MPYFFTVYIAHPHKEQAHFARGSPDFGPIHKAKLIAQVLLEIEFSSQKAILGPHVKTITVAF